MNRDTCSTSGRRLVRAVWAAALACLVVPAMATAADWQLHQVDADGFYDAATMDADGNGCTEELWFDLDSDSLWDAHLYNTRGGDCFVETLTYDMDENGRPEYRVLDIDQKVGFEWVYFDPDQNGRWNFRRIVPGSSLDYTNRINRLNASRDQLFRFRMRTGQSLLYPTFPMP